ncbi:MAG TPA: sulfotransferase [Pirellulales bacterium]
MSRAPVESSGKPPKKSSSSPPWYGPRIWMGMTASAWFPYLARHGFRVAPSRWFSAASISLSSITNSGLFVLTKALYGRKVDATEIRHPPVFILGHWRSGTTLLHELFYCDPQFTCPTVYQCTAPSHFLVSERVALRFLRWLAPSRRAMDNMDLGLDRPQEEDFALANLGLRNPYSTIGFPNDGPQDDAFFELDDAPPEQRATFERLFLHFLKSVAYRQQDKRFALKSPPHTFRIPFLLKLFPDARFIHIVRDPYTVFPSTVHLWKTLYQTQGMQIPTYEGVEEYVLKTYERMMQRVDDTKALIAPNRYSEVRYEDLVANPLETIRSLYERLSLGDFENARPGVETYLQSHKDYKTNRYKLTPEQRASIEQRWGKYIERWGYTAPPAE